jgi:hypothetical protein
MTGNGEAPPVFAIGMACRDMMHSMTAFDFAALTRSWRARPLDSGWLVASPQSWRTPGTTSSARPSQ